MILPIIFPQVLFAIILAWRFGRSYPRRTRSAIYARVARWSAVGAFLIGVGAAVVITSIFGNPDPHVLFYVAACLIVAIVGACIATAIGVFAAWIALRRRPEEQGQEQIFD